MIVGLLAPAALAALHLLPRPAHVSAVPCPAGAVALPSSAGVGSGVQTLLRERFGVRLDGAHPIRFTRSAAAAPQGYALRVDASGVTVRAADDDGVFYAMMTLGQLASHGRLLCVAIDDAPALRWRILSDDVSRGPLPTQAYFERRIRIAAAYKFNGYSPYMEHVFASPTDPLPALGTSNEGITAAELRALAQYARRFHVAFIPEQQTFAHMHQTLRVERYAPLAELPHGYLLAPNQGESLAYVARLISQERAAVGPSPFFHIGSDETATLGEGQTQQYVAQHGGRSLVYAQHVTQIAALVAPSRAMIWDDGVEADPSIMAHLPQGLVIVNWHYGDEATFQPYIDTIARGGFEQMVAPGARNWNEIFPQLDAAIGNERRFISQGKASHVLGLFQTVWHDDGETMYEPTWPAVLYAAAAAWESGDVEPARFYADLAASFYHDDAAAQDVTLLAHCEKLLGGSTNKVFWSDPFADSQDAHLGDADIRDLRLSAERVMQDTLRRRDVPEVRALFFAAHRFDALGRRLQIAREVRAYYADATQHPQDGVRDLFWCKYFLWEMRDTDMELASEFDTAWHFESGDHHYAAVRLRYDMDAQRAIARADAIDRATYEDFVAHKTLPPFESVIR